MKLAFLALALVAFSACHQPVHKFTQKIDTVVVAYKQDGTRWMLNLAIRKQYYGRKFMSDSGLDAKMENITVFRLRLPVVKSDSLYDSVRHSLLNVRVRYQEDFLSDTLTHYIHLLDSLH